MFMASDVLSANAIAGIICRSPASRAALIEHCYLENLAIIEASKPVVLALANAYGGMIETLVAWAMGYSVGLG
jgi:hypothetical protein